MKLPALPHRLPRWVRLLLVTATTFLLLYAGLGFLVFPRVLQAKLPSLLAERLGREVKLQRVRMNPFTLSLTLEGLWIQNPDSSVLLGWERLYVNVQASSAFRRTLSFKAIELQRPKGHLAVEKGGRLNIDDILQRLSAPKPGSPSSAPTPTQSEPLDVAIAHLRVSGASLELEDRSLVQPFSTTLGPFSFDLRDFRTVHDSSSPFALEGRTESGERFAWEGSLGLDPLASKGTLRLENLHPGKYAPYFQERVGFILQDGRLDARCTYSFTWSAGHHQLHLQEGRLHLRNLRLGSKDAEEAAILLPSLELLGLQADLLASRWDIATLRLSGGQLRLRREENGSLDLAKLFTWTEAGPQAAASNQKRRSPVPAKAPPAPTLRIRELALADFKVDFKDRSNPRPVSLRLGKLDARLIDFTLDPNQPCQLELDLNLEQDQGHLRCSGPVWPWKARAEIALQVENLDLLPLDPYLEPTLDLRLKKGRLDLEGRSRLALEGKPLDRLEFKGRFQLQNLEAIDARDQEAFLTMRRFLLEGVDLEALKRRLRIKQVTLVEMENRLVIARDGSSNVERALKLESAPASEGPPPNKQIGSPAPLGQALPPTEKPLDLSIQSVKIHKGRLVFVDRSLEPNAALLLTDLEGHYEGLSLDAESSSRIELRGRAGGLAPLLIQGRAQPLRTDQNTDVLLRIQGSELSDLGPYAGRYLGYTVRKGKLDLDARVRIQQRRLDATLKARLDQFFLGDKTGSPEATKLPVRLILAILRDRHGVIDLDLPVRGSLDDPDFRYGRLVWKTLGNLATKISTSPFQALGRLLGGADTDLSFAPFEPGSATPGSEATAKCRSLSKALLDRPELILEAEGTWDSSDRAALQKQALERQLSQARAQALGQEDIPGPVPAAERETWLRRVFETAFPSPPSDPKTPKHPALPAAELEQRLLARIQIPASELEQLADARARSLLALLQETLPSERLFKVEEGAKGRKEPAPRVYFGLKE